MSRACWQSVEEGRRRPRLLDQIKPNEPPALPDQSVPIYRSAMIVRFICP